MKTLFGRLIFYFLLACFLLLTLNTCGSRNIRSSGFLENYSQLRFNPREGMENSMVYWHPSKTLKGYNQFIIDPVRNDDADTIWVLGIRTRFAF